MIDYKNTPHHPIVEELVDLLVRKTKHAQREFFRVEVAYFLSTVASVLRTNIESKDRGKIPVNTYTILLGNSGIGKGYSIGIMERKILGKFQKRFINELLPKVAEKNIIRLSQQVASRTGEDVGQIIDKYKGEYIAAGPYTYAFDSGTVPAIKQMRHKLILAQLASLNIICDELGMNLASNMEVFATYLELYDQGLVKSKLIKNTKENKRNAEIPGKTPANMLLFGTPSKLFDGSQTEQLFMSLLDTGYARRCFFALADNSKLKYKPEDATDLYLQSTNGTISATIDKYSSYFEQFADETYVDRTITIPDDVAIALLEYQLDCENKAEELPKHKELHRTELMHRYFKASKLAGVLAFIDKASSMTKIHLAQAIKITEESGNFFHKILIKDKPHELLAQYIAEVGSEVTQADLVEALPFYNKPQQVKTDILNLAIAWGYKNNILIKRSFQDGVELLSGESLKKTNLDELIVSYSEQFAEGYMADKAPFNELQTLFQTKAINWCTHAFKECYRREENVIDGFNLIVLDVDTGVPISIAKEILSDWTYAIYTTKSHTEKENRYRVVLPTNYILKLDEEDFRIFMKSIQEYLPLGSDTSTHQRNRKWNSFSGGEYHSNVKELFDVLPFIPKTKQNDVYINHRKNVQPIANLTHLENWFIQRISTGDRNNQLLKYALMLADNNVELDIAINKVKYMNSLISNPLDNEELTRTIMKTLRKRYE